MYGGTPHLSSSVRRVDYQCPLWGSAWRRPASFRRRSFTTAAAAAPVFLLLILLLIWRCILPRLGARPLQFLGRQLAVMVDIKLVEQGIGRGGKFGVIDAAILVPVHHRGGGGLVGIDSILIDLPGLFRIQAAIVMGVMGREFRPQSLDQLVARDRAVVIGIVFQQYRGIAAVIILVARLFGCAHPGWRLLASATGGERQSGKQDKKCSAQSGSFVFPGD